MIIFVQKLTQMITSNTAGFLRIQGHNKKILKRILKRRLKYTYSFISTKGQASALKVAYVFKVFGAKSCLMVA